MSCDLFLVVIQHLSKRHTWCCASWFLLFGCPSRLCIRCFCREEECSNEFDSGLTALQFLPQTLLTSNKPLTESWWWKLIWINGLLFFFFWIQCFRFLTFLHLSFSVLHKWEYYYLPTWGWADSLLIFGKYYREEKIDINMMKFIQPVRSLLWFKMHFFHALQKIGFISRLET